MARCNLLRIALFRTLLITIASRFVLLYSGSTEPIFNKGGLVPNPDDKPFPSFKDFKDSVMSAYAEPLAASGPEQPDNKLREMRTHLARMYRDIEAEHSFVDENGQIFDCVPISQQPGLKGASPASLPDDAPVPIGARKVKKTESAAQSSRIQADKFGNTTQCPEGTVPIRRLTVEELMRFDSLQQFFRKTPRGKGRHPRLSAPEAGLGVASGVHKYAHAFQDINNTGGHSFINIWQPSVGPQVFSLSQHWYAGGNPLQTVECGWQVYPQKYGHDKPVLFTYWTADDYGTTGCYNHDCDAFVQTNSAWKLGGSLETISTPGGQQFELEVTWRLVSGNWWLYLNGTTANDVVGYYPGSLFRGGQMTTGATNIDYGGEAVNSTSWPPMGSGAFADQGFGKAAYHRNIYFLAGGSAQQASLRPGQSSPACYTVTIAAAPDPWDEFFYYGGPGGTDCPDTAPVAPPPLKPVT